MATLFDLAFHDDALPALHQANAALNRGEIVVVPTDTVYGIAASPRAPGAIDALVGLKGRGRDMAPPILVASIDQATSLVAPGVMTDSLQSLLQRYWPGALTVVVAVNPELEFDIGATPGTIALRCPDHPALLELLRLHGPLAVTSANLHAQPPATSVYQAINTFGDAVSVYLGGEGDSHTDNVASTIVDATQWGESGGPLTLVRPGAISESQLRADGFEVS